MSVVMSDSSSAAISLIKRAMRGDRAAADALFARYRQRLKQMIQLRLHRALSSRVDASDVLQEAYLDAAARLDDFLASDNSSFYLWLRRITYHKIIDVHRRHLGAQARDARMEISLHRGPLPCVSSMSLAAQLLGRFTSPSDAAVKAEMRLAIQKALNQLDELDREVLALRHFEQLTNAQVAAELELEPSTASKRYRRALKRMQETLKALGILKEG
jgi:RNA polymerase sigma-70 factor (ECF subfamily)